MSLVQQATQILRATCTEGSTGPQDLCCWQQGPHDLYCRPLGRQDKVCTSRSSACGACARRAPRCSSGDALRDAPAGVQGDRGPGKVCDAPGGVQGDRGPGNRDPGKVHANQEPGSEHVKDQGPTLQPGFQGPCNMLRSCAYTWAANDAVVHRMLCVPAPVLQNTASALKHSC